MTNKTAAARYARALFDVALKEKIDLDRIDRELAGFVELFDQYPALAKVLLNPAVPVPRKRAAVEEITTRMNVLPVTGKLLALLADRDRLILLRDLLASYRDRVADYRKIVRAEVTTATPIPASRAQEIQKSLAAVTGRTVTLQTRVDPSIIGGIVARVGSVVYDASVTHHLQKMKERLEETV
jgi:F-type H+-transporting ATPase subunit delta